MALAGGKSSEIPSYTSNMRFEDLNLSDELLKGLYAEMKFKKPSKLQAICLPAILTPPPYKNFIAQEVYDGSGKTTCSMLAMLSRIDPNLKATQAICICPSIQLSIQNMEVLQKMGKFTGITSRLAIPTAAMPTDEYDYEDAVPFNKMPPITAQVIIGTPGMICRWTLGKKLGLSQMKILVFDEAAHMLTFEENNYREALKIMRVISKANSGCQVVLFSATFDEAVKTFVDKMVGEIFVRDYNKMLVNPWNNEQEFQVTLQSATAGQGLL